MFKHSVDKLPVALIAALTGLDFWMYFTVESTWVLVGYYLLMIMPKGVICAWSHHHQHHFTFRSTPLNRLLELSHGLHTGFTTHLWVLHHVLGHHLHYQDQSLDESRWKRSDGQEMGKLEYTLSVAFTAHYRAFRVGQRHPRQQLTFVTFTALALALVALLCWAKPLQGVMLFAMPMVTGLLWTAWATYDHHRGLETDDPFQGSFNITDRWYNVLTGNLGFHTAHHKSGALHWSQLPKLHERISDQIPEHLYYRPFFDPR